jgi:hypothetical protein
MITLSGISPSPGGSLVGLNTPIEFTIIDDGSGIDINSLIVDISGDRAINNGIITEKFNGALSEITISDDNYIVVIDNTESFHLGQVYEVKVQVKTLLNKYFNTSYSFKTIPNEPYLSNSSPRNNETLISPQVLFLEFSDIIDGIDLGSITISINGLNYIENGTINSNYNGGLTTITDNGSFVYIRIDPIEALKSGNYILKYEVADTLDNLLKSEIKFNVALKESILPSIFPQTGFLGYFQGINRVSDIGKGDSLLLEWNTPVKRIYQNDIFVILYQNNLRLKVFDTPKYFSTKDSEQLAEINGLIAGKTYSFGARALEIPIGVIDTQGMNQVKEGLFLFPERTFVSEQFNLTDTILRVDSVEGYPSAGLLVIGREIIRYNAINRDDNTFSIMPNGRGLINSIPSIYIPGDEITFFSKCMDSNTVIVMATPTHQDGYGFNREINNEGLVVSDFSDNDRLVFEGFDFCGWHDPRPDQTLNGKSDCGSYLGGEFGGMRGFDLYNRMLDQEEVLLTTTGEPVILLKRIWNGKICDCVDSRKMGPKMRSCPKCFGTTYDGGFTQFNYMRRKDRRILVSFDESAEDLYHGEKEHLQQDHEPNAWTLPIPAIKDRDLLVRFDLTEDTAFFYEVLNTSREIIFNRKYGRQRLSLKRLDKTDVVYTFKLDLSNINRF